MPFSLARPDLPYALQVEITTQCNLRCRMCPLTVDGTLSSLTPGHVREIPWREVVELARETRNVIIAGFGEPLLHPDCMSLLQELDRSSVWMSLATNGTAITEARARQMAELLNLVHINVSIDSPDPATYRAIRGGELERALRGLRNLMAAVSDANRVTVSSVAMASNLSTLSAFPPLLAELGVRRYILQGLAQYSVECESESLADPEVSAAGIEGLRGACSAAGIELICLAGDRFETPFVGDPARPHSGARGAKVCTLPWEMPFIDRDGRVFPCCYASTQSRGLLGDLREQRLPEVWQGERYQRFRTDILAEETTPEICRSCAIVPMGEHPMSSFAASLQFEGSCLQGHELVLLARNTGSRDWTREDCVRIGTANPRDHASPLAVAGWMNANRVTTFSEDLVRVGETATFRFSVNPTAPCPFEMFQLVVEGKCWIPNTRFRVIPSVTDFAASGSSRTG